MKEKRITPISIKIDFPSGSIYRQITSNKRWLVKLIQFIEKEDSLPQELSEKLDK